MVDTQEGLEWDATQAVMGVRVRCPHTCGHITHVVFSIVFTLCIRMRTAPCLRADPVRMRTAPRLCLECVCGNLEALCGVRSDGSLQLSSCPVFPQELSDLLLYTMVQEGELGEGWGAAVAEGAAGWMDEGHLLGS